MSTILKCYVGICPWTNAKGSCNSIILDEFKKKLQGHVYLKTGLDWDRPDVTGKWGTSTTGNTARELLHKKRKVILSILPDKHRQILEKWGH